MTEAGVETFEHLGHRLAFRSYGEGERTLVLVHGLLMSGRMFDRLAPEMATRGNHVICLDLLGHGRSEHPEDLSLYSMPAFGEQVVALLDHLGLDDAVVGGTSLGANVSLEVAVSQAERTRGLFVEMPVLDNALVAVALAFTPVLALTQLGAPPLRAVSLLARSIPRTHHLLDIGLDWARRDPASSARVLQGLLLGRTCPPQAERRKIAAPALVVGHPDDPLHPFSDAGDLADEIANGRLLDANSILEWRLNPGRLNDELAQFLEGLYEAPSSVRSAV